MDRASRSILLERLTRDAEQIARRYGLRYKSLDAERPNVKRRYGVCYADGSIRIRLRHAVTGRPLKYSSLVNTLCHELAHLRHFNHGARFKAFYFELLDFARAHGIYRPGEAPRDPAPALAPEPVVQRSQTAPCVPRQLLLFEQAEPARLPGGILRLAETGGVCQKHPTG